MQSLYPDFLSQKPGITQVLGDVYLSLDGLELGLKPEELPQPEHPEQLEVVI